MNRRGFLGMVVGAVAGVLFGAGRSKLPLTKKLGYKVHSFFVIDGAIYRAGFQGPNLRNTRGRMRKAKSREVAQKIVEWAKAGATITLGSQKYPSDNYKWNIEWPDK